MAWFWSYHTYLKVNPAETCNAWIRLWSMEKEKCIHKNCDLFTYLLNLYATQLVLGTNVDG